jgi:hypothetical protein
LLPAASMMMASMMAGTVAADITPAGSMPAIAAIADMCDARDRQAQRAPRAGFPNLAFWILAATDRRPPEIT